MNIATHYKVSCKEIKRRGRKVVASHYLFLVITCLFAAFVGNEFTDALMLTEMDSAELIDLLNIPTSVVQGSQSFFSLDRGVFASLVTSFGSGSIYDSAIQGINSILGTQALGYIIVISLSIAAVLLFWFFIGNTYTVISRRIFLESRIYKKVSPQRFLFLFHIRKWVKVSTAMLVRTFYLILWSCVFIVGGLVKRYSYFLVAFILAENPDVSAKDAITLSRRMMMGHKLEAFKLELSYIGWIALRALTFGLSGLFYSNAYQVAAYTEFYVEMRALAKTNNIEGSQLLNDTYLYQAASAELLQDEYADVVAILQSPQPKPEKPSSIVASVLDFLGIALHRSRADEQKELAEVRHDNAEEYELILEAKQYPSRLLSIDAHTKGTMHEVSNYKIKYTIPTIIMFFFIFSFIGWAWEVALYLIEDGVFVNRGTMYGPWLPIYGSGGLLILLGLYKLRKNAVVQFFAAMTLCGVLEYFTSYALEVLHDGTKWWDYSGYFINLNGRICGEGLLVFGLGGIAVVYALAPHLAGLIGKMNRKLLMGIVTILIIIFAADALYSLQTPNTGEGITSNDTQPASAQTAAAQMDSSNHTFTYK